MQTDQLPIDVPARKAWLLGIGGMGVGPLAIYMQEEGWQVSGWDDALDSSALKPFLVAAGTQFSQQLNPDAELVGRSSAVKPGNPLYDTALERGARLLRRGELLAERVATKKLIAVCGSHGKTTTSGMLAQSLQAANVDAGFVLGGLYKNPDLSPAHFSKNTNWVVAEVDESDGTIQHFSPEITITVNLDWDHPDYYHSEAELEQTFRALYERTRGAIFVPAGNERLARLTRDLRVPVITVGDGGDYTFRVVRAGADSTTIELGGRFTAKTTITLPVIGTFNTQNAMLALAATDYVSNGRIGVPALGKFNGMRRRQDILFANDNLKVFADYAHHPTEIAAFLKLLRETQLGKVIAVFQPHRYSRTRQYATEFANALSIADTALLMPVYSAGEAHVDGGDSSSILRATCAGTQITLCENANEVLEILNAKICEVPNEQLTIAFVGAGDIDRLAAIPFARECWLRDVPAGTADFATRVKQFLSPKTKFEENKALAPMTTLGIGGNARWFAEPENLNDLILLLRAAANNNIEVFTLGRGSNLLVADEGFNGLVIHFSAQTWKNLTRVRSENCETDCVKIGAGTRLKELCGFAAREGLSGFEFLCGIPGTLGGALRMNAGAHGNSIFDRVISIEWLMPDGSLHKASREHFAPVYRDCPELHGAIILSAVLASTGTATSDEINFLMATLNEARAGTQPVARSAGCTFKNPTGDSAGRIIDSLGLKGTSIGKARVSEIHANFIVAENGATAADVRALIARIQGLVATETSIELQPEIEFLGF